VNFLIAIKLTSVISQSSNIYKILRKLETNSIFCRLLLHGAGTILSFGREIKIFELCEITEVNFIAIKKFTSIVTTFKFIRSMRKICYFGCERSKAYNFRVKVVTGKWTIVNNFKRG
jgi:hypothetical protein